MAVRKRGSIWYFDFMVKGVRYRQSVSGARTKQEALRAEAETRQAVHEGRYGKSVESPQKFREFVEQVYLPWAKTTKKSWYSEVTKLRVLCNVFGDKNLSEISPMAIERYKRQRKEALTNKGTPRSPQSVNIELNILSRICDLAINAGLISINPMGKVKRLKCDNARDRVMTDDEEARLLEACTGDYEFVASFIILAVNTAMRSGEIKNLRWVDVDFVKRQITVRRTKSRRNRVIPMNQPVIDLLRRLKETSQSEYVITGTRRPDRKIYSTEYCWKRVCLAAGVKNLRVHDLRHTTPSRLANMGVDAFTIREILGHSTMQMASRYTHVSDARKREALDKLSQICHNGQVLKVG